MADELTTRRLAWFQEHRDTLRPHGVDLLNAAYQLFVRKLGASPEEVPLVERGPEHVVIASRNFCPTLEACKILGLDTRIVCKHLTERPMADLLGQLSPRLRFSRRYESLRPHGDCCLEVISLAAI